MWEYKEDDPNSRCYNDVSLITLMQGQEWLRFILHVWLYGCDTTEVERFLSASQRKTFVSLFKAMQGIETALWRFHEEFHICLLKCFKQPSYTYLRPLVHTQPPSLFHCSSEFIRKQEPQFSSHRLSNQVWEHRSPQGSGRNGEDKHPDRQTHHQTRQLGVQCFKSTVWFKAKY